MGLLIPLDEKEKNVKHRPAKLYKFNKERYNELKNKGFTFEI